MRAELRAVHSPDVPDLASWRPDGPDFVVLVQLLVGPADGPGEESFDVVVCSVEHLRARVQREGPVWLRHTVVVQEWVWPALLGKLRRRVSDTSGETWEDLAVTLARWGRWEFEDYTG